jgi:plasmid stabilization system protein ParE
VSAPFPVRIVSSAARAIVEAAEWWVANRPKAPGAFTMELERALQLIASQPSIGAQTRNVKLAGVRRIHLPRIHYHLYYRVTPEPMTVEILALWHTKRGVSPDL